MTYNQKIRYERSRFNVIKDKKSHDREWESLCREFADIHERMGFAAHVDNRMRQFQRRLP